MDELLCYQGAEVKALGDGKLAGYLVRWGGPKDADLEGDFFSKDTDLGVEEGSRLPVYYQHGFDGTLKSRRLGRGVIKFDDVGAWFEAQLDLRDEYEQLIYKLAEDGKLGWSSGAAGHLVEREQVGKAWHIKSWVIAEASLTPQPAEPRNVVTPVKSLFVEIDEPEPEAAAADEVKDTDTTITEDNTMDEDTIKQLMADVAAQAAAEAVKSYAEAQPQVKAGYDVEVVEDETDKLVKTGKAFATAGEFFKAVKDAAINPAQTDKRLLASKASGLNEAMPSQGGFLVQQDFASGIMEKMWGVGSLLNFFNPITVSGNGLLINVVDETSRADGYRQGGLLGYWLEEAGTKIATKPKFAQLDLKLKKVAAACYATDELLEDAVALESWLNRAVPDELRFRVEDAILNGDGVGKPLGILAGGALVSATRTDASEIDSLDVTRMWAARYPGATDYIWLINANAGPQLYNMSIGNYPVFLPPGGLSGSMYGTLMGRPVVETDYNPGLGTLGDIMLISPSNYVLITKGGIQSASSIHVQFLTDETTFRFVYRVDGQPAWSSAVTAFKSSASISPFVALAATT